MGEAEKNLDTFKLPSSLQRRHRAASLPFLEWNKGKPKNNSENSPKERKSCCSLHMKWKQLEIIFFLNEKVISLSTVFLR